MVLTGGPGAGKTAVLELVRVALCRHVALVPEAASLLFRGGFPRVDTLLGRECVQRAIVSVQVQMENLARGDGNHSIVLCDRGTVDSLAYWPGDEASLLHTIGSTRETELARYACVIHLRTPGPEAYNHKNPDRIETVEEAHAIDEAIVHAWRGHPNRHFVAPHATFLEKARIALALIENEVPSCCAQPAPVTAFA